jgi:hypothetical protein
MSSVHADAEITTKNTTYKLNLWVRLFEEFDCLCRITA